MTAQTRWINVIKQTVAWLCGDPGKLWTVYTDDWRSVSYTSFWLHKNATAFVSSRSEPFVDLIDEAAGRRIKVRDNPDGVKQPPVYVRAETVGSWTTHAEAEAQAKLLGDYNLHN